MLNRLHRFWIVMPIILLSACAAPTASAGTVASTPAATVAGQIPTPVPLTQPVPTPALKQYANSAFGLRFQFPAGWYGPDEYISGSTLRVAVGSDVVYPYGEPPATPSEIKNSYLVVIQYSRNSQDQSWQDTYSTLAGLKDGGSLSGTRSLVTRVRQLDLGRFKGFEFISTLSATAQTEHVYSREVLLVDDQSDLLTILGSPNNVEVSATADWREVYRMLDEANKTIFQEIVGSIKVTSTPTQTFAPQLTHHPLVWFGPLPPMPTGPGRMFTGSDDFMSLFKPDAPWQTAAHNINVFKLYGEWVAYDATADQLRQVVEDLNRRDLALAVEAGPLNASNDCGQGIESFAGIQEGLKIANRIKIAGGTIHLIALDEPYYFGHFYAGLNACHWTAEKIAAEVDHYIQAVKSVFPDVLVGDTEPLAGAANDKAYQSWLDTFRSVNQYDLAFLHMDVDWSRPAWAQEVLSVEKYGKQIGVPIGIIYTGNAFDTTDESWISAAGERVKKYELQAGGQPDQILFQSWNDKPDFVLPETQPFTFTNFIDAYFTDKSSLGFKRTGAGANLALGKTVLVSNQLPGNPGVSAVDGDLGTWWSAGSGPLQWIQIDLGAAYEIQAIRLTISQYPAGNTVHRLLGKGPGSNDAFQLLNTFTGSTLDGQTLTFAPAQPIQGIQFIRLETTISPSWVAWREIEVVAAR